MTVRDAIGDRGEVTALDGAVLTTFASAADAVSCAIRLQRRRPDAAVAPVRIGLDAGHVPNAVQAEDAGSVAGIARLLGERAEPGTILCSATVTRLVAGRPRFAFASLGSAEAGGAVGGEAYQVRFDTGEVDFSMPVALAGRQAETARLVERFQEAASGRGGLVMLAGEQGIGKTRLADEVATRAERDGFTVLWGRCHEGEGPRRTAPSPRPWKPTPPWPISTCSPPIWARRRVSSPRSSPACAAFLTDVETALVPPKRSATACSTA